jgi:hypothetical protein
MGQQLTVKINLETDYEEDEGVITAPYYCVIYTDDWNRTHMAMIKDVIYLEFIKERFYVKECRFIAE